jgi:hypothetical protein
LIGQRSLIMPDLADVAQTNAIERIARVLAGRQLSANADGADCSAAEAVDASWSSFRDDAVAILKTLREPDAAMARAGDAAIWTRMVEAALGDDTASSAGARRAMPFDAPPAGTDPLHEGP